MYSGRLVPILGICGTCLVAFALLLNFAAAKKDQIFDGIFVEKLPTSEFYPGATGCPLNGMPYAVIANSDFYEAMPLKLDDISRPGVWHIRLKGDLSRVGRYEGYWRVIRVTELFRTRKIDSCEGVQ
jgi:hypothetical protein